ncbi:MAG: hypothetical protein IT483_13725, partial [Gammaproteobacteria bacterium]|nr:hypothetical protein [Gammaproteobacteria bacterium]
MHHYPFWKSLTVIVVLLIATLVALPNLFGESPALQLSRKDRAAFEAGSTAQFEQLLKSQGIAFDETHLDDAGRMWLRFSDVATQLQARDAIQRQYEGQFAMATTFASRAPAWLTGLGLEPMSLGLDLRGGIYLVYEVDVEGAITQLLQVLERDTRKALRDKDIPYDAVSAGGSAVTVTLRDPARAADAIQAIKGFDSLLTVSEGSVPGQVVAELTAAQIKQRQDFA